MAQLETEKLSNIISLELASVLHEGKDLNFLQAKEEAEELVRFAKDLLQYSEIVRLIPSNLSQLIDSRVNDLLVVFNEMQSFSVRQESQPIQFIDSHVARIVVIYQELFPMMAYVEAKKLAKTIEKDGLVETRGETTRVLEEVREQAKEAREATEAIKGLAGEGSISHYRGIFSKQSNDNRTAAKWWLVAGSIAMIASIVLLAYVSFSIADAVRASQPSQNIIALVISKLFLLAVVIFALQVMMRNYFANMHQATLNRHRENALEVFGAMVKAGFSDETKDAVLAFLAKAIFDSGDTGFLPGKDMSKDAPDVLQMVRDVSKIK